MRASGWIVVALLAVAGPADADRRRVKELVGQLRSKHAHERSKAAQLLGQLGRRAKSAVPALANRLLDGDATVRTAAANAIYGIGSAGIPALVKLLNGRNERERIAVANVLLRFGPSAKPQLSTLARHLDDPLERIRTPIADLLGSIGEDALDAVLRHVDDSRLPVRLSAARALRRIGKPAVPELVELLGADSASKRAGAALALGTFGREVPEAAPALVPLLGDDQENVRVEAALALGQIGAGGMAAVEGLLGALRTGSPVLRDAAADALVAFGESAHVVLIEELSRDEATVPVLARCGAKVVAPLSRALGDGRAPVRAGAALALGGMPAGADLPVEALRAALADPEAGVRRAVASVFADRAAAAAPARAELLETASDSDAEVRRHSVTALGRVGEPAVRKAVDDPDAGVRIAAQVARWRLGDDAKDVVGFVRNELTGQAPVHALRALATIGRPALVCRDAIEQACRAESPAVRLAAVESLGALVAVGGDGILGRAERLAKEPATVRASIALGLDWLARFQDTKASGVNQADGRWDPLRFLAHADEGLIDGAGAWQHTVGVTGLALLAFLSAGHTDRDGPYAQNIREGLDFLLAAQTKEGTYGTNATMHFLPNHAVATLAVVEAWFMTDDPRYRDSAQRALDFIEAARNPYLAWRYEVRGGENDTEVTVLMVHALRIAERSGLPIERKAYDGARVWLRKMMPVERSGYNSPGSQSARTENMLKLFPPDRTEGMHAAGLWARQLVGLDVPDKALELCRRIPPAWNTEDGSLDLYYYQFGALVFSQLGSKSRRFWMDAVTEALLPNQHPESDGVRAGSWPPLSAWSAEGGRVYVTAMGLLTLLAPVRYEPGFLEEDRVPRTLRRATRDAEPAVREAAARAVARLER